MNFSPCFYSFHSPLFLFTNHSAFVILILIVSFATILYIMKRSVYSMKRKTPLYVILFKVFHAQRGHSRPYMESIGLSPGQPKLLNHLIQHGECLQKDLAAALDVEPGTVSKLLGGMEESGYITRNSIAGDKRAILISLTEEGRKRQELYSNHMKQVAEQMMQDFSAEEKEAFENLLCRAYRNLTEKEIL